jgi:hypothetical protein
VEARGTVAASGKGILKDRFRKSPCASSDEEELGWELGFQAVALGSVNEFIALTISRTDRQYLFRGL